MAHYLNNDLDYWLAGDLDTFDFDDDSYEEDEQGTDNEFDLEDNMDMNKQKTDTLASEARKGKDIQGIPWEKLNFRRAECREMRLKQYKNFENLSGSHDQLKKECKKVEQQSTFYDFQFNTRLVKSTIGHFQLRNLLWTTSKNDIYMIENCSVMHWSSLLQRGKEVLSVARQIMPTQKHHGSSAPPLSRVQISTMSVKDNLMVAGGFQGELLCKYLSHPGVAFAMKVTNHKNAITNAVDIYSTPNGSIRVMTANNDNHVRVLDTENFALLNNFSFPWSVNSTSVSPDGKLLAVLGDSTECLMTDAQSGKVIGNLKGHLDYSFASAWHPDGHVLATGNQDMTCRLWDVRKLSESFAMLKGKIGAIRGIKFSSDGHFMAMAEPADFVHIFDTKTDYCKAQEIDMFGEIAGISFSPDTEALFIGIADRTYGSLLEFSRRHQYQYLDSIL